jgi:hypothetical protein
VAGQGLLEWESRVQASRVQDEVVEELLEWREDVAAGAIGSRVVLLAVPAGWGRSTVVALFREQAGGEGRPVFVEVDGGAHLGDRAVQATGLRQTLEDVRPSSGVLSKVAQVLEVDTAGGLAAMGLEVGSLFVPGLKLAGGLGTLLGSRLLSALGKAADDGPAGEAGAVAKAARATAAVSVHVPVVVVMDDADLLDAGLARTMITALAGRPDGRVLVVAAASPSCDLVTGLLKDPGADLAVRVRKAEASPKMDYPERLDLAQELLSWLPDALVERAARRTGTFADLFRVAGAERLAELDAGAPVEDSIEVMDAVIDALLERGAPTREAIVLAWAGGALHERQVDACLTALGGERVQGDPNVRRAGALVSLADPLYPRWAAQVAALSIHERSRLAEAVLAGARQVAAGSAASLADRVAARQAVHRIRADVNPTQRDQLPPMQGALIRGLESLGDMEGARQVAWESIGSAPEGPLRRDLRQAYLRVTGIAAADDPVAAEAIRQAVAAGASIRLEARVWAAANLLARPGDRAQAEELTGQIATELDRGGHDLGDSGDQWRLLLAIQSGKAGLPSLAQQLLAPMLASDDPNREKPARAVLHATAGQQADTRLQVILLEAELATTPADAAQERLRIHQALQRTYATLGMYRQALAHAQRELECRALVNQPPELRDVLVNRDDVAFWTGESGDEATALEMYTALVPDMERVLGPDHLDTMNARSYLAFWAGECGDLVTALEVLTPLVPDVERVLGPDHPDALHIRQKAAFCTGQSGDWAAAAELYAALLPDAERLLSPDDRGLLTVRGNRARAIGECGDCATALELERTLLPDTERVLGPDHPDALISRNNLACWTGECGDAARALEISTALLPDMQRVHGSDHPHTLVTRRNVARWTGQCGDAAAALEMLTVLLPDMERVLGISHPQTLKARSYAARWTGECGDAAAALEMFTALLPDQERVLGFSHPDTIATRNDIADWAARLRDGASKGAA